MGNILRNDGSTREGERIDLDDDLFRQQWANLDPEERAKFGALVAGWAIDDIQRRLELVAAWVDGLHTDATELVARRDEAAS